MRRSRSAWTPWSGSPARGDGPSASQSLERTIRNAPWIAVDRARHVVTRLARFTRSAGGGSPGSRGPGGGCAEEVRVLVLAMILYLGAIVAFAHALARE